MVLLQEIIDLKDKMVRLMFTGLELKCSELPSSRMSSLFKSQGRDLTPEDLVLVFTKETRQEMLIVINKMVNLLTNGKPTSQRTAKPPPPSPTMSNHCQNPTDSTKAAISEVPLSRLNEVVFCTTKVKHAGPNPQMTEDDRERAKLAFGYYIGTNPKPNLGEVAEKFNLRTIWLYSTLLDNGIEVSPYWATRFPLCYLRHERDSLKPIPPQFNSLKLDPTAKDRLTREAAKWIQTGPHRLHIDKTRTPKEYSNCSKDITTEQRQDILDFYLKHHKNVSFMWILDQVCEKYRIINKTAGKLVVESLLQKSGKDIKSERKRSRYYKFEDKKELILNYARSQKLEELTVSSIVQMFNLNCTAQNVTQFLKENGIQVMTQEQKRAKKLADQGLPYTRAEDPEKAKRYYINSQKKRKARLSAGGSDSTSESSPSKAELKRNTGMKKAGAGQQAKKSPTKRSSHYSGSTQQHQDWNAEQYETDEAIAQLNDDTVTGHQYATRSTPRHQSNFAQYYQ